MKKTYRYYGMMLVAIFMAIGMAACGDDKDDDSDNGNKDTRIDQVIPSDIRKQVAKYIPIYDGKTPPNVEGVYVMSPPMIVFDSTDNYDVGDSNFADLFLNFRNQNMSNNTIDFKEKQSTSVDTASGAFISGEGNNFSVYFNTTGTWESITYKTALVVSGTKTSSGISNIYYAFIMTDKKNDVNNEVMDVGDFRVFKDGDGLAEISTWPAGTRGEAFGMKPMTFTSSWNPQY